MSSSDRWRFYYRKACLEQRPRRVSDEKIQGMLENVFGLKVPAIHAEVVPDEAKFNDMLVNVFGLTLPSEIHESAATIPLRDPNR